MNCCGALTFSVTVFFSFLLKKYKFFFSDESFELYNFSVPGGELFDRVVQENYILTEMAVVMIICQLCEAVEYIHSKHIVHLDIKVILTPFFFNAYYNYKF